MSSPKTDPNLALAKTSSTRNVPLKVIGVGLSRTGTSSLRQALLKLGYQGCYHFECLVQEESRKLNMWVRALEAKYEGLGKPFEREEWDELLSDCMALTDTPCTIFIPELLAAYPEAKVILTVRSSPLLWHASILWTIIPSIIKHTNHTASLTARFKHLFLPCTPFDRVKELMLKHYPMLKCLLQDYEHGTQTGLEYYSRHIENVKKLVPEDRLLMFNVSEGWEPLCRFLGKEVPKECAFPRINSRDEFNTHQNFVDRLHLGVALARFLGSLVGVGLVAFVCCWALERLVSEFQ